MRGGGGPASGVRARRVNGNEDEGRLGLTARRGEGTRTLTRRRVFHYRMGNGNNNNIIFTRRNAICCVHFA